MRLVTAVIAFAFIFIAVYALAGVFLRFEGMPLGWIVAPGLAAIVAGVVARGTYRHGRG